MQKSTILFLLISLIIAGCGAKAPIPGLVPETLKDSNYKVRYFSDRKVDYVYKANVSVYGNDLTGILVFKRVNDKTHRVVLTTEFGNTLFDLEVGPEDHKINSIVDELNRQMLVNVLVSDFRLMLREKYDLKQQFSSNGATVLLSPDGKIANYLYLSQADGKLLQIKQATTRKHKVTLEFHTEKPTFAERIIIEHHDIKLKISLQYLKNQ